ncbi:MAG: ribonuclease E [Halocynthiibacter sp.]|jgi:ribonuclease E
MPRDFMAKKMLIDATHAEETRVVVVDGNKVEEFDFESENKRQNAGNIYLAKVTRVEPSLQAAFVDYGGNRHGFLAFSEIHPDYYQIPVADREALMAEERAYAKAQEDEEEKPKRRRSRGGRGRAKAEETVSDDAIEVKEPAIGAMDVVDLGEENGDQAAASDTVEEGTSPAFTVHETPVEEPADDDAAAVEAGAEAALAAEDGDAGDDASDENDDDKLEATDRDENIESVADEDVQEEIRQVRKPRPRKYKIQEVVKVRQILLIQVVKEERGNKGAALTTYLSLAGRYCVLMPNTARGGGISRKITNAADRKKLKEIAQEIEVPEGAGLIVRTAGAQRTKSEIGRDYEYLQRLWEQIRALTLKSIAPAKIYEEGDLIKRSIRDLYNKDIDEVIVEGEAGYRTAKDFMKMIMPSHAKNVKNYSESLPLFARFQVEGYLASMFNPTVQLRSGGYIVIDVTEALVAVDVNSGRATKEGSIEDTATKTNLEAAEEVARQMRLRDLAGLIVIDFIDMDERRNNAAVEKKLKDKLKTDRARIQVGRISGFGLLEMSRQRLRPGMLEATTQPCNHCHGTGLIRSDDNLALTIIRALEEEGTRRRSREVLVKAPVSIINFLINNKREHIAHIEARYGMAVRLEADPFLISPDYSIEKFKTATRVVREATAGVVSVDSSLMDEIDDAVIAADEAIEAKVEAEVNGEISGDAPSGEEGDQQPRKRRRRRRRRKNGNGENGENGAENGHAENGEGAAEATDGSDTPAADGEEPAKPKRTRSRGGRGRKKSEDTGEATTDAAPTEAAPAEPAVEPAADDAPKPKRTRTRKPKAAPEGEAEVATAPAAEPAPEAEAAAEKPKRVRKPRVKKADAEAAAAEAAPSDATLATDASEAAVKPAPKPRKPRASRAKPKPAEAEAPVAEAAEAAPKAAKAKAPAAKAEAKAEAPAPKAQAAKAPPAPKADDADKPKKKGWWSLTR